VAEIEHVHITNITSISAMAERARDAFLFYINVQLFTKFLLHFQPRYVGIGGYRFIWKF